MYHKAFWVRFLALLLLFPAAGAIAQDEADEVAVSFEDIVWQCPEDFSGQTLNIFNWSTYIGETTVDDFSRLCNVNVNYDVYESNESMIARLRQGNPGYDLVFPSDYAVAVMLRDELLLELDFANIPNYANIADEFKGLDYDPEERYSVPYLWGSFGVLYNTERVPEGIKSWNDVFNHDGLVAWIADVRAMFMIGLHLQGFDPNSLDPDEIEATKNFLLERSGNVVTFAADDGQTLLERGEVDIALDYNGDAFQLILDCDCDTYAYVIPEEGSIGDVAAMVIPDGAQNKRLAEAFIDYVLDPAVSAMLSIDTAYANPNRAAVESGFIPALYLDNPAITPDEAAMKSLFFAQDITEAEDFYNNAWDELIILAGG